MKRFVFCLAALALSACATKGGDYHTYLQRKGVQVASAENFQHCSGYGCKDINDVHINNQQWHKIEKAFNGPATSARQERKKIAQAIGVFEKEIGKLTGTDQDVRGTFGKMGKGQLDCVDESINTTVYLSLLSKKEFLKYHDVRSPTVRVPLFSRVGWPHQTALISERATGAQYVVDSWFHDNGEPAEILPLKDWKEGWSPEDRLAMN